MNNDRKNVLNETCCSVKNDAACNLFHFRFIDLFFTTRMTCFCIPNTYQRKRQEKRVTQQKNDLRDIIAQNHETAGTFLKKQHSFCV
jgi:hypothetical protein